MEQVNHFDGVSAPLEQIAVGALARHLAGLPADQKEGDEHDPRIDVESSTGCLQQTCWSTVREQVYTLGLEELEDNCAWRASDCDAAVDVLEKFEG